MEDEEVGVAVILVGDISKKVYMATELACRYLGIDSVTGNNFFLEGDSLDCPTSLKDTLVRLVDHPDIKHLDVSLSQFGERLLRVSRPTFNEGFASFFYCEVTEKCTPVMLVDLTEFVKPLNLLRDFVANVSHEIRTPVAAMEGAIETLIDGALDDPGGSRFFVNLISRQVQRLAFVFEDMLLLSKIESQHGCIVKKETLIKQLITEVIQYLRPRALEKSITIKIECDDDLRATINDRLFFQALSNLLTNCIKFSKVASLIIVQARVINQRFILRTVDSGVGIAPEHIDRIFERFYRVDTVRSRSVGGTGLGLAIVDNIAKAHGGQVQVTSKLGVGSTFTISVPTE